MLAAIVVSGISLEMLDILFILPDSDVRLYDFVPELAAQQIHTRPAGATDTLARRSPGRIPARRSTTRQEHGWRSVSGMNLRGSKIHHLIYLEFLATN